MHVPDRLDLTLRLVRGSGRLTLADLAERLGVSEMTVRRDLDQLQQQGLVRRVRGGAVALDVPSDQAGFTVRERWQAATKTRLAETAAALIQPGGTVLLDAGTTTAALAGPLCARAPLTVAVLSLQAAVRLADQPGIKLLVIGGESRAGERSLVGPLALSALDQLRFDTFVMSIGAVHHDLGWSEFDLDDAAVKRAALRRAGRTIVVADAGKLGVQAFARVAPLDAVETLVTDALQVDLEAAPTAASRETLAALRSAGVNVVTPTPSPTSTMGALS